VSGIIPLNSCVFAQTGQLLLFPDLSFGFLGPCDTSPGVVQMGENVASFVTTAAVLAYAVAGGDPHIPTFQKEFVNLAFQIDKNYVLYASPDFRVVIHTDGKPWAVFYNFHWHHFEVPPIIGCY
jgi:hypothetical protein